MMDLLVQITTAHRINPGGHVIQVMNARSDDFLYYKPSTPIGKLKLSAEFSTLTNHAVCLLKCDWLLKLILEQATRNSKT